MECIVTVNALQKSRKSEFEKMNISFGKRVMGLSIKGKLLLLTLSISLIPIATITVLYYINARDLIKKDELDDLTAIAESEKGQVTAFIESKKARTLDFSTDGFIREKLETINYGRKYKAIENLNKHLSTNKKPLDPSIVEITILDTIGKVVASTNKSLIGLDMSVHEAFTQAIRKKVGETFTGQPRYSPVFDTNCILISAPIITSNGNGKVVGVIINVYDPEMLIDITDIAEKEVRTVDFCFDMFIRGNIEIINRGNILNKKEAVTALSSHLLMNKKHLDPHIIAIDVANRHGKVVASTNEKLIGQDVSHQEAFAKDKNKIYDEPCISKPYFNSLLRS